MPTKSLCERQMLSSKRRHSEIQKLFFSALRDDSEPLTEIIEPIGKLSAQECIRIYARGYSTRLTETLAETFDATWWVLGDNDFFDLSEKYIWRTVSHCYDLSEYGYDFPEFLSDQTPADELPFLPDLARFEWLFKEIFHRPNIANGPRGDMEFYENSRFSPSPSAKLFNSRYPVYDIWNARSGPIDKLFELGMSVGQKLLVYKQDSQVRVRQLAVDEFLFMQSLFDGNNISKTLDIIVESLPETSPDRIREIFSFIGQTGVLLPLMNA